MALPDSGAIKLSEIASQYGGSAPHSLKDYYRNGTEGVPNTASTQNIPTSGAIGLKDFYGSAETNNRDIRVWMSYLFSPIDNYGFGVTSQSSTAAPGVLSNGANAVAWQPVFRAGQGYITSASITISQNENVAAYNNKGPIQFPTLITGKGRFNDLTKSKPFSPITKTTIFGLFKTTSSRYAFVLSNCSGDELI